MQNGNSHLMVFKIDDGKPYPWALQYADDNGPIAHFETEAEALACRDECHRVAEMDDEDDDLL